MAEIKVHGVELQLTTVKLSTKVLRQLPKIEFNEVRELFKADPACVIGWIHGLALGDEWNRYLLIKRGEGDYGLVECMDATTKKYKQIFV